MLSNRQLIKFYICCEYFQPYNEAFPFLSFLFFFFFKSWHFMPDEVTEGAGELAHWQGGFSRFNDRMSTAGWQACVPQLPIQMPLQLLTGLMPVCRQFPLPPPILFSNWIPLQSVIFSYLPVPKVSIELILDLSMPHWRQPMSLWGVSKS